MGTEGSNTEERYRLTITIPLEALHLAIEQVSHLDRVVFKVEKLTVEKPMLDCS